MRARTSADRLLSAKAVKRANSNQKKEKVTTTGGYVVQLLPLTELLRHEEHDPEYALRLSKTILLDGALWQPVVVEEYTLTLLDGHHRVAALTCLGCRYVPSVLLKYDDPRIALDSWRPDQSISKSMVLDAAMHGRLLPFKTSRHRLTPDLGQINISLSLLYGNYCYGY